MSVNTWTLSPPSLTPQSTRTFGHFATSGRKIGAADLRLLDMPNHSCTGAFGVVCNAWKRVRPRSATLKLIKVGTGSEIRWRTLQNADVTVLSDCAAPRHRGFCLIWPKALLNHRLEGGLGSPLTRLQHLKYR